MAYILFAILPIYTDHSKIPYSFGETLSIFQWFGYKQTKFHELYEISLTFFFICFALVAGAKNTKVTLAHKA